MADTGAPYFIPFADPTDLVRDWPALSEDVAEAVADGLDAAGNAGIGSNVVQAVKTDEFTTSSSTYVDVTGLSVTITPSSDTSKVLLLAHVNGSSTAAGAFAFRFTGGNSTAYVGDSEGARTRAFSGIRSNSTNFTVARVTFPVTAVYLDSPVSAAPVTYKVQMLAAAGTVHVNRVDENVNEAAIMRTASSLTVVEVAG